jgi:predicted amidohydrolase
MRDIKVTVASLKSTLADPNKNLGRVKKACAIAHDDGARILFLPELMLTGHGGHPKMVENAEPVPDGLLSQAIIDMSKEYHLCICVGIAELTNNIVYNSQMVADKGKYLGLQRKINLSLDECCYFGVGETVEAFDIGDVRFGITICYDNRFPELALIHSLNNADLILAPHAGRTGKWPEELTPEFCTSKIRELQNYWEKIHRARAFDHNVYVLLNNAVGSSTDGLENVVTEDTVIMGIDSKDVVANHVGTVMGVDPDGEVFLRTSVSEFVDEIVTVELKKDKRKINYKVSRNRRPYTLLKLLQDSLYSNRHGLPIWDYIDSNTRRRPEL